MKKLSTGDDATIGNYLKLATAFFGKESKAVKSAPTLQNGESQ